MKKLIGVFVIAGSMIVLSFAPDGPATAARPSGEQAALRPKATTRLLSRGDVLMPQDPLLVMMAKRQENAQRQYKSMTHKQKVIIERYKPRKKLQQHDRVSMHRELVASYRPDATGELHATLISDSDRKAWRKHLKEQMKAKQKEEKAYQKYLKAKGTRKEEKAYREYLKAKERKEREKSLAEKLISPILFPMTTENVQKCKFTVLLALPDMVLLRFEPEPMNMDPIFSGQVFVNPQTGDIYRLEIDALYNFEKIEKRFKYLKQFYVAVDYIRQPDGYRFPAHMQGKGFAKVLFFKGNVRFEIAESEYTKAKEVKAVSKETDTPSGLPSSKGLSRHE